MSQSNSVPITLHRFPDSKRLWHENRAKTESLGCRDCFLHSLCGGLRVDANVYDCDSFCTCAKSSNCDNVCPNNLDHYVARLREVSGFDLMEIKRTNALPSVDLPSEIPLIYHGAKRITSLALGWAALPLYPLLDRKSGRLRFHSSIELRQYFGLEPATNVILSGTQTDPSLERWWGISNRAQLIHDLRSIGVSLVTTPNFSLFDDVPRADNLYNMKRIALSCVEFIQHGMPAALHVNARTERDYERWAEFIAEHEEIEWLSVEFGTGAGRLARIRWHAEQLVTLTQQIDRPLGLIPRGGLAILNELSCAFKQIAFIDTTSFVKAQRRQIASCLGGRLSWSSQPTAQEQGIEELIYANVSAMQTHTSNLIRGHTQTG